MKKLSTSLTEGPILKTVILYTIPIILTGLLQLLFNAADLVVVGRFCGSQSVAAVGATGSLTTLIINLFIGLSSGSGVAVAQAYGAHDTKTLHRTIHTAVLTAFIAGGILTFLGITFSRPLLVLMGTPENILVKSSLYMKIYFGGMLFNMTYNYCASILRAMGDTRSPLIFLSTAGVVNVLLNVVFVTVFHMDVAGVALATTISQAISAFLVVTSLMRRADEAKLFLRELRIYKKEFVKIISIGLPAGIQSSIFSISNVIIQSSVNSFGDVFMSGNAAAANIEGFIYTSMNSFMQTSVNFTGQNFGAKNKKRILRGYVTCLACVTVLGVTMCSLVRYFAPNLLSIYITDSAQAIQDGLTRMDYVCALYFLCGMMEVNTGAIRGLGVSLVPMIIGIVGVVGVRIGWIYTFFTKHHTPQMLFISYPASWLFTTACLIISFIIVYKIKTKNFSDND